MLVMYGDQGSVMIALMEDKDLEVLKSGRTLTFQGPEPYLMKNLVVFSAKDKAAVIALITAAGVPVHEESLKEMPIPDKDH